MNLTPGNYSSMEHGQYLPSMGFVEAMGLFFLLLGVYTVGALIVAGLRRFKERRKEKKK